MRPNDPWPISACSEYRPCPSASSASSRSLSAFDKALQLPGLFRGCVGGAGGGVAFNAIFLSGRSSNCIGISIGTGIRLEAAPVFETSYLHNIK